MKKEFTQQEMTKYLKTVMELEASLYTQEEALRDAEEVLQERKPVKKRVKEEEVYMEPGLAEPKEPIEPIQCSESYQKEVKLTPLIGVICFVVGVLWRDFGYVFFAVGALAFVFAYFVIKKAKEAADEFDALYYQYICDNRKYQDDLERRKGAFEKKKAAAAKRHQERVEEAEKEYELAVQNHKIATAAIELLRDPLKQTEEVLEKLYALDVIYDKYRNIIAISSFYEYFASNRVSKLTGANGAYNLFEQEIRMDVVINKLDVVIEQLEDIKENQYALYQKLDEAIDIMNGIYDDVNELVSTAHRIEDAAYITAHCAKVTATNTEVLKYISLLS